MMLFAQAWSRNHIFIVFEGLSSQIVLHVDKTLHDTQCGFTSFGQGDLIASATGVKQEDAFFRDEEDPEMHSLDLR